jgi:uncharacterized cupin superfamily protein
VTSPRPVVVEALPAESGVGYPEPFRSRMGQAHWRALGDPFGITQFGVSHDTLQPGASSSVRHWHTLSDEWLYVLEGELVLCTDEGETQMRPGMCVGFKAGERNGHQLLNRGAVEAKFIVVGSRVPGDLPMYPDDDLAVFVGEAGRRWSHKDGTTY